MNSFKKESIQAVAQIVAEELGCTLLEAVTKMQGSAARKNNESMLEDLIEFKRSLIEKPRTARAPIGRAWKSNGSASVN